MDAAAKGIRIRKRMLDLGLTSRDIQAMLAKRGVKRSEAAVSKALKGERLELLDRIHGIVQDEERARSKGTPAAR